MLWMVAARLLPANSRSGGCGGSHWRDVDAHDRPRPANNSEYIFVTLVGDPYAEIMEQEADRGIASGSGRPYNARALDPWQRSAQTDAIRHEPGGARHRQHHRCRHICTHGPSRRGPCRSGHRPVFHDQRDCVRFRRHVLCGNGVERSDLGKRLYLRLCHDGRTHRLDHRLGSASRIRVGDSHRGHRLVRLCRELRQGLWHHGAGHVQRSAV